MRLIRVIALLSVLFTPVLGQSFVQAYPPFPVHDWLSMLHWGGDTVFACGTSSGFSRSTDAGLTWTPVHAWNAGYEYTSMGRFRDEIVLLPSASLKTKDEFLDSAQSFLLGYRPWDGRLRRISYPVLVPQPYPGVYKTDLTFCSDGIVVMQESEYTDTTVYKLICSTDGGIGWQEIPFPNETNTTSVSANRKALFRTIDTGFVVADPWPSNWTRLYFTSTGGKSWIKIPDIEVGYTSQASGNWLPGQWVDAGHFVVLCRDNFLRMTTDDGATWSSMTFVSALVTSFSMHPDGSGIATGSRREVYATSDWGATWNRANPDESLIFPITSVSLALGSGAFVVGTSDGTIITSTDGGRTLDFPFRYDGYFNELAFCDARVGFAVITDSRTVDYSLFSTSDGGSSWTKVMNMMEIADADIVPVNGQYLWAIRDAGYGNDTMVYRSVDGGVSWTGSHIRPPGSTMKLIANDRGFSFGADSLMLSTDEGILRTTDGGASWETLPAILLMCDGSSNGGTAMARGRTQRAPFKTSGNGRATILTNFSIHRNTQWIMRPKKLLRSYDYGRTWEVAVSIADTAHADYTFTALNAASDSVIFARTTHSYPVPPDMTESVFHRSTNGGRTWTTYTMSDDIIAYSSYVLANIFEDGTGYVLGGEYSNRLLRQSKAVVKLIGGGQTLERIFSVHRPYGTVDYWAFHFIDAMNGWFAINTRLFRTTNGGVDWIETPAPVVSTLTIDRLSPNPVRAGGTVTITYSPRTSTGIPASIEVFDILGRRVFDARQRPDGNTHRVAQWNTAGVTPGVYFVLVRSGSSRAATKLVVN